MKVALVHDFLVEYGGAERVLEALHEIWPNALLYTAFCDKNDLGPHKEKFKGWKIKTSWVQYIPFFKTKLYSPLRFLAPYLWKFNFGKFDVVVSSTNMYFAKNIDTPRGVAHFCYCHTPPRSLYGYPTKRDWERHWYTKLYGNLINHFLRIKDFQAAQKPDYFIANSREVKGRIKKFYRRDAKIIYPPVDIPESLEKKAVHGNYFLMVGRLALAKRVDFGIKAAKRAGVQLKVVGAGIEEENLLKLSGKNVQFLGEVSDEELAKLYRNCRAVLFLAQDEDFGIVPVEGMAYGKPVIGARSGGVVESVIDGKTGILLKEPLSVSGLAQTMKNFKPDKFDAAQIRKHAQKFSKERFKKEIERFVQQKAS